MHECLSPQKKRLCIYVDGHLWCESSAGEVQNTKVGVKREGTGQQGQPLRLEPVAAETEAD